MPTNPKDWPTQTEGKPFPVPPYPTTEPLMSERERRLDQALRHIVQWVSNYPVPPGKPMDFALYRLALEAAKLNLDDVTNASMRHALSGVGTIAQNALDGPPTPASSSP